MAQVPQDIRWQRVRGHHVLYGTRYERGQLWIWFVCEACGDVSKKPCTDPRRASYWGQFYAGNHARCGGANLQPRYGR